MSVALLTPMPAERQVADGVYLTHGEGRIIGDGSGGIMAITFMMPDYGPPTQEMWFPLWFSLLGPGGVAYLLHRQAAVKVTPTTYYSDLLDLTATADGGLSPADCVGVRAFLRKPFLIRTASSIAIYLTTTNVNAQVLTSELWALKIVPNEANWDDLIRLLAIL